MEQLMTISSVGFIISAVLAVIGAALSAVTFWKFNIREIFMIRSGRGLRNAVISMEKQRAATGTLRNAPETGEKKTSKKSKKKASKSDTAAGTGSAGSAADTAPLKPAPETVPLSNISVEPAEGTVQLSTSVSQPTVKLDEDSGSRFETIFDHPLQGEPAAFDLLSAEMDIHTDEVIDE